MRLFLAFFVLFLSLAADAVPPTNVSVVEIDAQAGIERSASTCATYAADTTVDLWATAPAEVLTTAIIWQIRYVTIQNLTKATDAFADSQLMFRAGPLTNTPVLASTNGLVIMSGQSFQPQVRRPNNGAAIGVAFPGGPIPLWIRPVGIGVRVCTTYHW